MILKNVDFGSVCLLYELKGLVRFALAVGEGKKMKLEVRLSEAFDPVA
jgi:hypothetical protein